MKRVDKFLRQLVPSLAKETYTPIFKNIFNLVSLLPNLYFPEFKKLPPNHLRVRVGVGNRLFFNQIYYMTAGISFWLRAFSNNLCAMNSNIVDIGCGCGRTAHILRDYAFGDLKFFGHYTGIDIDNEAINWCNNNFPADCFSFMLSTDQSSIYNIYNLNKTQIITNNKSIYSIPLQSGTQDFVFSLSLFTHLLEPEIINYLEEAYRILKIGGFINMSFFSFDNMREDSFLGGRHNFRYRISNAYVENQKYPESAVAYENDFICEKSKEIGFKDIKIYKWDIQSILQCRK